jgi:hypothetical protein
MMINKRVKCWKKKLQFISHTIEIEKSLPSGGLVCAAINCSILFSAKRLRRKNLESSSIRMKLKLMQEADDEEKESGETAQTKCYLIYVVALCSTNKSCTCVDAVVADTIH